MWQWKTQCKRSVVLQKALITQCHVECFGREAQTSVQSLKPEYRHHWKWSPGKFKWGNDKWGWLPISTGDCKEEKMDSSLLMPFCKTYFSQTVVEFRWNTSYYTQCVGRQVTPDLTINESCQRRKRIKSVFHFQRSEIQQIRTWLATASVVQMPAYNPASSFRAALGSQSLQDWVVLCFWCLQFPEEASFLSSPLTRIYLIYSLWTVLV